MKKKNIFSIWFWTWVTLSIILVLVALIVGNHKTSASLFSWIMATFYLFPGRDWMYRFLVWGIDFLTSINTTLKDRINPYATYNRLITPTQRETNVGFYRVLFMITIVVNLIIALLWLIFTEVSYNTVYAFIHSIEFIVTGKVGFVALLTYILLAIAYFTFVWWFVGQVLNGRLYTNTGNLDVTQLWKIISMIIIFYIKIILSGLLMKYTIQMIMSSILFWTTVIGVPILILEGWKLFQRRHNN